MNTNNKISRHSYLHINILTSVDTDLQICKYLAQSRYINIWTKGWFTLRRFEERYWVENHCTSWSIWLIKRNHPQGRHVYANFSHKNRHDLLAFDDLLKIKIKYLYRTERHRKTLLNPGENTFNQLRESSCKYKSEVSDRNSSEYWAKIEQLSTESTKVKVFARCRKK